MELPQPKGKVYLASMNMRGQRAQAPENTIIINVTSAQPYANANRIAFSPMHPIPGGYKGYWNFESYWQSGKVFEGIPHENSRRWWLNQREAKRRYPNAKGLRVLHAQWEGTGQLDYVASRKQVYVPEYYNRIKDLESTKSLVDAVNSGKSITVYDFDGPRTDNGGVSCLEITRELLIQKINDTSFPFGHGYIVAATLLGIPPDEYCR